MNKLPKRGEKYINTIGFDNTSFVEINRTEGDKVFFTEHWDSSDDIEYFLENMELMPLTEDSSVKDETLEALQLLQKEININKHMADQYAWSEQYYLLKKLAQNLINKLNEGSNET